MNIILQSLEKREDSSAIGKLNKIRTTIQQRADKASWEQEMIDIYDDLEEITDRLLTGLNAYGAKLLSTVKTKKWLFFRDFGIFIHNSKLWLFAAS